MRAAVVLSIGWVVLAAAQAKHDACRTALQAASAVDLDELRLNGVDGRGKAALGECGLG